MRKYLKLFFSLCLVTGISSCGYTTGSLLPSRLKMISVENFKNKVDYGSESRRNIYLPLLEVKVTNAVVDRFLFDGSLKIADSDTADLILRGELLSYDRSPLRYFENSDDVEEYRIHITVSLVLWDVANDEAMWQENRFVGESTYFTSGPLAVSEATAVEEALTDLARRIVERTIENW